MKELDIIKNRLNYLDVTEIELTTSDYGEEDCDVIDTTLGLELCFYFISNYSGTQCMYLAPRKVRLIGNEVVFDLEEMREFDTGEVEVLDSFENQTVEDLMDRYPEEDVKKVLGKIQEYIDIYRIDI